MRALYFDCASGISGNMTLGALLELVDDQSWFLGELEKLHVDGYQVEISLKTKNGITGTYVDVVLDEDASHHHEHHHHDHSHEHDHHHDHDHSHEHHHHHHEHRHLADVYAIIDEAEIDEAAKELARKIFLRVAEAEAKVHNMPLEEVHFHEVGAIDSIVDIIGTAILITKLEPELIYSSVVNDGYGFVECAHGMIPVPVPATSEILAKSRAISRQIGINTELVTPTGAAIIAELACSYGPMPAMDVQKIGWGCGTKDLKIPNVLKVSMGDMAGFPDQVLVMETNIDDCSGEILGYVMDKLFVNGAKDVFFTPIFMKKNRPAYRMTVVCDQSEREKMEDIIFRHTTTIGIRYRLEARTVLSRKQEKVQSPYGDVLVKTVQYDGDTYIYPEFESLKTIAEEQNVSIHELYQYFINL